VHIEQQVKESIPDKARLKQLENLVKSHEKGKKYIDFKPCDVFGYWTGARTICYFFSEYQAAVTSSAKIESEVQRSVQHRHLVCMIFTVH